jgi:hypothetical protein
MRRLGGFGRQQASRHTVQFLRHWRVTFPESFLLRADEVIE